jgi:hypothetical protein
MFPCDSLNHKSPALSFFAKAANGHAAVWEAIANRVCKPQWLVWGDVIVGGCWVHGFIRIGKNTKKCQNPARRRPGTTRPPVSDSNQAAGMAA